MTKPLNADNEEV